MTAETIDQHEIILDSNAVIQTHNLNVFYDNKPAVRNVNLKIVEGTTTAIIGLSGCGKSTVLRALNRIHEVDKDSKARTEGQVFYRGINIYDEEVDAVEVRRKIGIVAQKPNPFPKSIYYNVAYAARIRGVKDKKVLNEIVESSLKDAALWDEVKNNLNMNAFALSGGQQQRLCFARAISTDPDVLLLDEPTSSVDPITARQIENLILAMDGKYTIVMITHNKEQIRRASKHVAFFGVCGTENNTWGELLEYDSTEQFLAGPQSTQAQDYLAGRIS